MCNKDCSQCSCDKGEKEVFTPKNGDRVHVIKGGGKELVTYIGKFINRVGLTEHAVFSLTRGVLLKSRVFPLPDPREEMIGKYYYSMHSGVAYKVIDLSTGTKKMVEVETLCSGEGFTMHMSDLGLIK